VPGALIALVACGNPDPVLLIDDVSPSHRLAGVRMMDRPTMVAHLDALIAMSANDPDPVVRREVLRELGYTRDPRVLPVLTSALEGADGALAAESLGYYGSDACDVLAARWVEAVDGRSTLAPDVLDGVRAQLTAARTGCAAALGADPAHAAATCALLADAIATETVVDARRRSGCAPEARVRLSDDQRRAVWGPAGVPVPGR
jgi:hypothetical protein